MQTFEIGGAAFLLDGEPFLIRSGELHFPRIPREYWRHRLRMCRALGLNAVSVYLFWNFHERERGAFEWDGQADAAAFCSMAQEEGLWVLLRPGPYACAEWEMGGLPWWLLKSPDVRLRSCDPAFLEPAVSYLQEVGRRLAPLQITKGGPVIMVQVENEHGFYADDPTYMAVLRSAFMDAGFDVPLFACNPFNKVSLSLCSDLFQVVNFHPGKAAEAFAELRKVQPSGPLMCGEYYSGWFDLWGREHKGGPIEPVLSDIKFMLENRHSFSLYMAHGGTSFGLWSGAVDRPFRPDTSSYDYDAPISEAGWPTPKFHAFRAVIAERLREGEEQTEVPTASLPIAIEPFTLSQTAEILDHLPAPVLDEVPHSMENYAQGHGLVVYRTMLPEGDAGQLTATVHDFGWTYMDGEFIGMLDRRRPWKNVQVPARSRPARINILVEPMGRVNFGDSVHDRKGLQEPVSFTTDSGGVRVLTGWEVFLLPLDKRQLAELGYQNRPAQGPAFWTGVFAVPEPGDTFLDLRNWGKGVVWVNDHCLGRYWNIGPTQTMYCPGPWLRSGANEIVILNITGPETPVVSGLTTPILDQLRSELDPARPRRAAGPVHLADVPAAADGSFDAQVRWQEAHFADPVEGRYLCLEALDAHDGKPHASIAGLVVVDANGAAVPSSDVKVVWVSSEEVFAESGEAENAIDERTESFWHSEYSVRKATYPHCLVLDLGRVHALSAIRYLPRAGGPAKPGRIRRYRIYVADRPFGLGDV